MTTEQMLVAAYKRGFNWARENGWDGNSIALADLAYGNAQQLAGNGRLYVDKAAHDYADAVLSASPSPVGSHKCRISKETLAAARSALAKARGEA